MNTSMAKKDKDDLMTAGSTGNGLSNNQLQMQMPAPGRKTENVTSTFGQQGNDFIQQTPPMRNSMRSYNQVQMKSYDQLLVKFSNEPGLIYRDMFVYPNNSIYRGQMKRRDDIGKMKVSGGDNSSNMSHRMSQRLSEDKNMAANATSTEDENIMEFRHGYGI